MSEVIPTTSTRQQIFDSDTEEESSPSPPPMSSIITQNLEIRSPIDALHFTGVVPHEVIAPPDSLTDNTEIKSRVVRSNSYRSGEITCLTVHRDKVLIGTSKGDIWIYDKTTMRPLNTYFSNYASIKSFTFSVDFNKFYAISGYEISEYDYTLTERTFIHICPNQIQDTLTENFPFLVIDSKGFFYKWDPNRYHFNSRLSQLSFIGFNIGKYSYIKECWCLSSTSNTPDKRVILVHYEQNIVLIHLENIEESVAIVWKRRVNIIPDSLAMIQVRALRNKVFYGAIHKGRSVSDGLITAAPLNLSNNLDEQEIIRCRNGVVLDFVALDEHIIVSTTRNHIEIFSYYNPRNKLYDIKLKDTVSKLYSVNEYLFIGFHRGFVISRKFPTKSRVCLNCKAGLRLENNVKTLCSDNIVSNLKNLI
jgi:hypothetical protein